MLVIRDLSKKFGKKEVLRQISCELTPGVYGLLGPNGAGKTTLMRCITELYSDSQGEILWNDKPIRQDGTFLSRVGYLPQKFGMFRDLTVYEAMELLANLKGYRGGGTEKNIRDCIELVNLTEKTDKKVRTLSGGMLKRLGIAQALLGNPDLLIFDEPTAGLDPEERLRFKLLISKLRENRTVLISTHIVSDIEAVCDHVMVMNDGRLVLSGSCEELRQKGKGKVYLAPQNRMGQAVGDPFVQGQYESEKEIWLRILSNTSQPFESVEPTLEDGYLCVLKEI